MPGGHLGRLVAGTMLVLGLGARTVAAQPDTTVAIEAADADLAATTAPPWNPPRPVPSERAWEVALGFPFRLATAPLALVGLGIDRTLDLVEETNVVTRLGYALEKLMRQGIELRPASLGDRTGFGGTVAYAPPPLRGRLAFEASGSSKLYTRTEVLARTGPVRVGYRYDWRPREQFFGTSAVADFETARSTFAVRAQTFRLELFAPWRTTPLQQVGRKPPMDPLRVETRAWVGPRESILRRGREAPSIELLHPGTGALIGVRQEHFVYGAAASVDTRIGRPHWTQGFRVGLAVERFDKAIAGLAIRDGHTAAPTFTRLTWEGQTGVSFMRDPRTVRIAVRIEDITGGFDPRALLPSDLTTLGGSRGLSGFEPGRFHDVDGAVGKLSYIFPLTRSLEMDLHAEAGAVVPTLSKLRRSTMAGSYGFAFRPRRSSGALASVGVDWSEETVRVRYSFGRVE